MNNVREIQRISKVEASKNISHTASWHAQYKDSAYIFVGGFPFELTEGDLVCVFSQFGEILDINLVRDRETGKSKGFCFIKYEDQRSTILAVDNLNGIKISNRTIRVDHANYKRPEDIKKDRGRDNEEEKKELTEEEKRWKEEEEKWGGNVAPEIWVMKQKGQVPGGKEPSDDEGSDEKLPPKLANLDPDDPMYQYLLDKYRKKKGKKKDKRGKKKDKKNTKEKKEKEKKRKREKDDTEEEIYEKRQKDNKANRRETVTKDHSYAGRDDAERTDKRRDYVERESGEITDRDRRGDNYRKYSQYSDGERSQRDNRREKSPNSTRRDEGRRYGHQGEDDRRERDRRRDDSRW